jgi:hypothetical protein
MFYLQAINTFWPVSLSSESNVISRTAEPLHPTKINSERTNIIVFIFTKGTPANPCKKTKIRELDFHLVYFCFLSHERALWLHCYACCRVWSKQRRWLFVVYDHRRKLRATVIWCIVSINISVKVLMILNTQDHQCVPRDFVTNPRHSSQGISRLHTKDDILYLLLQLTSQDSGQELIYHIQTLSYPEVSWSEFHVRCLRIRFVSQGVVCVCSVGLGSSWTFRWFSFQCFSFISFLIHHSFSVTFCTIGFCPFLIQLQINNPDSCTFVFDWK